MLVFHDLCTEKPKLGPSAVAIGVFDGVHQGHQRLLDAMILASKNHHLCPIVFTFDPHPSSIVLQHQTPTMIEPLARRLERFEQFGVFATIVQKFDTKFAQLSAKNFVNQYLVDTLTVHTVVVGSDFKFGCKQSGSARDLKTMGQDLQFRVNAIQPVQHHGIAISSTRIRGLITSGNIEEAQILMGHPIEFSGLVVHGDKRGTAIGFPTANISLFNETIPANGVYAAHATYDDHTYCAVINIGTNPTFAGKRRKVEAHLLDFNSSQLYGEKINFKLITKLRDEKKFPSIAALKEQIEEDIRATIRLNIDNCTARSNLDSGAL